MGNEARRARQVTLSINWVAGSASRSGPHTTTTVNGVRKLCLLVMIGVRADGRKELVAIGDGYRESTESWADLLRDCRRRGMTAPVLAVGDGALGFWRALRDVSSRPGNSVAGSTSRRMFLPAL